MHDFVVPTESFEVEQYVRVQLGDDRTEIGVVASIQKEQGMMTVTTRHGYDIDVRASAVHRAFLLVLDLNGVLVARGRGTYIHRPHAEEFVRFVFNNFAVAVWTSGLDRSSNPIIDSVLRGYQDRLLFTWYRESCTTRPTADNPFGTVKNLQRIFDAYPKSFHSVNTIIIDDSPDKCSHPDIALCPIPFQDPATQGSDDGLLRVMDVLREVLRCGTHEPLIRAAEERLEELRLQGGPKKKILFNAEDTAHSEQKQDADDDTDQCKLEEVKLWKTRLCCEFLCGACTYGDECRYSHDPDDGKRPCSRKQQCRHGHASRWARTEGDAIVGARRRQQNRFRDDTDYFLSKKELFDSQKNSKSHTGMPHLDAEIEGRGEDPHPAQGFVKKNSQQRKFPAQRSSENAPRHDMEFDNRANGGTVRKQRKNAPQSHTGMPHLDAEIEGRGEASHTTLTSMKKHPQQESHTGMPHLDAQIEGVHHSSHSLSPFSTNPSQQQFMFPSEAPQDSQRNSGSVLRFFGDSSLSPGNDTSKKNRKGQPPKANTHAQSVNRIELTGSATDGRDLLRQLQAFTSKK